MSRQRLLLIEDNPDDIALARRAMGRSRVEADLQIAQSGAAALELLHAPTPDGEAPELPRVVFVDLNMPGLSGFDVLRKLREEPRTRILPVVVLTTSREPADIQRSYLLGANSFVTKPVDFQEFTEVFASLTGYWLKVNQAHTPRQPGSGGAA